MAYRLLVWIVMVGGCASGGAFGPAGTVASGGGGFTVTASSSIGFRVGENFDIGLASNMHFGNWTRTANAYGKLNEWARDGAVDCCEAFDPLLTFFKYFGLGMGYMTAWIVATDAAMVGPRLRYYVQPYAPTLYFDFGLGPAAFFDEDRADAVFGVGGTAAAGYMFDPRFGLEVRSTWGNMNDPQWATISVGLVIKPKKRFFGLFGKNDLERPPPKPQPYPPQGYPPPLPPPTSPPPLPPPTTYPPPQPAPVPGQPQQQPPPLPQPASPPPQPQPQPGEPAPAQSQPSPSPSQLRSRSRSHHHSDATTRREGERDRDRYSSGSTILNAFALSQSAAEMSAEAGSL